MTWVRRLARDMSTLVSLLVVVAPMWLGPVMGALSRAMGASNHVCACGMAIGKCGCEACARLERQRAHDRRSAAGPVLKSTCDDWSSALPSGPPPLCDLLQAFNVPKTAIEGSLPVPTLARQHSLDGDGPPTPPPRDRLL